VALFLRRKKSPKKSTSRSKLVKQRNASGVCCSGEEFVVVFSCLYLGDNLGGFLGEESENLLLCIGAKPVLKSRRKST
jgi:hypothetical protein